jgi:hypothetical protein
MNLEAGHFGKGRVHIGADSIVRFFLNGEFVCKNRFEETLNKKFD